MEREEDMIEFECAECEGTCFDCDNAIPRHARPRKKTVYCSSWDENVFSNWWCPKWRKKR